VDVGTPGFFIGESWIITDRVHGLVEAPSSWDVIPRFYALEGTMGRIHSVRWAHSQIIILLCYTYNYIYIYMYIYIYIHRIIYIGTIHTHMLHDFCPCVKQLFHTDDFQPPIFSRRKVGNGCCPTTSAHACPCEVRSGGSPGGLGD